MSPTLTYGLIFGGIAILLALFAHYLDYRKIKREEEESADGGKPPLPPNA